MATPIKISRTRFESKTYWTTPGRKLGRPLVICVRKSCIETWKQRRGEDVDQDLIWMKEMLLKLGFDDPIILDSQDANTCLENRKSFFEKLENIAQDDAMTTNSDVFLCIVMALGGPGYFYLKNEKRSNIVMDYRVQISEVVNFFKVDRCPRLACKPKIFIFHTDDPFLRKYDASLFGDGVVTKPEIRKIPVEADIMIYQSELSAIYSQYIAKIEPDDYKELIEDGLVPKLKENVLIQAGDNPPVSEPMPGTHFIFMLHKAAQKLVEQKKFDLLRWIFLTNEGLHQYLKTEYWKTWNDGKWSTEARMPLCTLQLTKSLVVDLSEPPSS